MLVVLALGDAGCSKSNNITNTTINPSTGGASGAGGAAGETSQGGQAGQEQTFAGNNQGGTLAAGTGGDAGGSGQENCPENKADCNKTDGSVCETDLGNDGENCGSCGHSCLGGDCVEGKCFPVEVAKTSGNPFSIATDGNYVFWVQGDGVVGRHDLKSGESKTIASAPGNPRMLALSATSVYWATYEGGGGKVLSVLKEGGAIKEIATGQVNPCGIAVDEQSVYWTTGYNFGEGSGNVWRSDLDGANPKNLFSGKHMFSIFAGNGAISWINSFETGSVYRANPDGSGAVSVADPIPWLTFSFLTATHVAWASDGPTDGVGEVQVKKTGGVSISLAKNRSHPRSVLIDGDHVLWANSGVTGGTIERASINGGTPEILVSGQSEPWGLTTDAVSFLWSDRAANKIMRLAR